MQNKLKIEVLVFEGCPHAAPAEKFVRESVAELGLDVEIEIINVVDNTDAVSKRFLGSPSVRIDGRDIEVEENELTQYSMRCRVYRDRDSYSGVPTKALILSAIAEAKNRA